MKLFNIILFLMFLLLFNMPIYAHQYHVSTDGLPVGNGSLSKPWDLQTALNHPSKVKPGDTLWIHGGVYKKTFIARLIGTETNPIIVRNYNNERSTIDGGNSNGGAIFTVAGTYTWFWGLEIMSSVTNKISAQSGSWPTDIMYGEGVTIDQGGAGGTGCKFINMIVHDTRQGFSSWKEALNSEVYGCVVYDNGWMGSDRYHGHNFYIQNNTGTKLFSDNYIVRAYSHNIQAYGSSAAYVNNLQFIGNIGVNGVERGFMLGSGNIAVNPIWKNNVIYRSTDFGGGTVFLMSYDQPTQNAIVSDNYFIGGGLTLQNNTNMTFIGNTMYNAAIGPEIPSMIGNTVLTTKPTTNTVIIRINKYEPKRANIIVFNWETVNGIYIDASSILQIGDVYIVRDAQNYFDFHVTAGVYAGLPLYIPTTMVNLPPKVGNDPREVVHSSYEFCTFILMVQ